MKPRHIIWEFWKILSLVTCGDLKVDLSKKEISEIASQVFCDLSNTIFRFFFSTSLRIRVRRGRLDDPRHGVFGAEHRHGAG